MRGETIDGKEMDEEGMNEAEIEGEEMEGKKMEGKFWYASWVGDPCAGNVTLHSIPRSHRGKKVSGRSRFG